ncbi:Alpha-lytic protease prodomain-containing protein [Micromonospora pallida]|uniref:Alpha-lytic protease prodomain-containing protein n=1 Tax=Micromonospora pallida TaxID=145854 RepID=A0A1C6SG96_9ACTN|nr:trypsin-like serine protease [Micromonospora pallida]SCL28369.1 Alpha-lytic protease prodomain-containing protein [Micromonospora pallida]
MRRIGVGWLAALSVAGTMLVGAPAAAQPVPDGPALERMKVRFDQATIVPAEVTGWHTDVDGRTLVVEVLPGGAAAARRFAEANGAPENTVRVVEAAGRPQQQSDRLAGGNGYVIGGTAGCTTGFAVTENISGDAGFLTAGHCALETPPGALTAQGRPLGVWGGYSFPYADMAWVRTYADWRPTAEVLGLGPVNGDEPAAEGTTVCRSGATTGVQCGTILTKNATIVYHGRNGGPDKVVTGLTVTDACSGPGDSGGPYVAGDQAQGVLSGGKELPCSDEDYRSYFQPIRPILHTFGLTLTRYWQGWTEVPGGQLVTSSPAVTTFSSGEHVFARRADGQIIYTVRTGTQWSGWFPVPGGRTTPSAPAVAVHNNMLYLFVRDDAGRIHVNTSTRTAWSGWTEVPGGGTSPSAPTAAVVNGELHLIVRAGNDKLVENVHTATGWSGWTVLPGNGATPDAPAVTELNGTLRLAVHATDGRIYLNTYAAGAWAGWVPVTGNGWTASPLGLTSYDGLLRMFARGGNDQVYAIASAGTSFNQWTELSGNRTTLSGPAANIYDGDLHLFVRGLDNRVYVNTGRA